MGAGDADGTGKSRRLGLETRCLTLWVRRSEKELLRVQPVSTTNPRSPPSTSPAPAASACAHLWLFSDHGLNMTMETWHKTSAPKCSLSPSNLC